MVIQPRDVVGSNKDVLIDDSNEHGSVNDRIVDTLIDGAVGLANHGAVTLEILERSIGRVILRDPGGKAGRSGHGRNGGRVHVVGANLTAGVLPREVDERTGGSKSAVVGDLNLESIWRGRRRKVQGGSVEGSAVESGGAIDVERWEVLPNHLLILSRARDNVWRKKGPSHRLTDSGLEENGHWEKLLELAENHLLASLGRNGLKEHLGRCARIEVLDETVYAALAPTRETLGERDELGHRFEGVVVCARLRRGWTEKLRNHLCVSNFLSGHKLDQLHILGGDTARVEVLHGKLLEALLE